MLTSILWEGSRSLWRYCIVPLREAPSGDNLCGKVRKMALDKGYSLCGNYPQYGDNLVFMVRRDPLWTSSLNQESRAPTRPGDGLRLNPVKRYGMIHPPSWQTRDRLRPYQHNSNSRRWSASHPYGLCAGTTTLSPTCQFSRATVPVGTSST